jgi:hypothetical protein
MTEAETPAELRARIEELLPRIEALAAAEPEPRWLASIAAQLRYLRDGLATPGFRFDRLGELNFGLLASHYVDDDWPELGTRLHEISNAARRRLGG